MKKNFITSLLISSLILAPALQADNAEYDDDSNAGYATESMQEENANDAEFEEGTPVGQAANDGSSAARSKRWQNIALAAGAVVVAVTAMILVANNDGHKK